MTRHRGLTLLEILFSVAILAMMAMACLPIITRSMRLLAAPEAEIPVSVLAHFADEFIAEPDAFGVESLEALDLTVSLPEPDPAVEVAVRSATADGADHGWILFTAGGVTVARWVSIEGWGFSDAGPAAAPGAGAGSGGEGER